MGKIKYAVMESVKKESVIESKLCGIYEDFGEAKRNIVDILTPHCNKNDMENDMKRYLDDDKHPNVFVISACHSVSLQLYTGN